MGDQATPIQALLKKDKTKTITVPDGSSGFAKIPGSGLGQMDQSTPIRALKPDSEIPLGPAVPVPGGIDPRMNLQKPMDVPVPSGVGQGQVLAERAGPFARKEFFGLQDVDWKSTLLVFALVLIFSSSILFGVLRPYAPSLAGPDGKSTVLGSVVAAIVASLVFLVVKFTGKF
jgi:hypothetical protein